MTAQTKRAGFRRPFAFWSALLGGLDHDLDLEAGAASLASAVARAGGLTAITAGDQIRKSNLDRSAGPVAVKPKLTSASASTFPFQAALRTT